VDFRFPAPVDTSAHPHSGLLFSSMELFLTCAVRKYARLICLNGEKSGTSKFVPRYSTLLFVCLRGKEEISARGLTFPTADKADLEYRDAASKGTFSRL
jgi:hypothetical protein